MSVRDIAHGAEVTLALVNYHGGGKAQLLQQVVERRADELIEARLQALARVSKVLPPEQQVRETMRAYMQPLFDKLAEDRGCWLPYFRLMTWVAIDDRWQELIKRCQVEPIIKPFIAALQQATQQPCQREATLAMMYLSAGVSGSLLSFWRSSMGGLEPHSHDSAAVAEHIETMLDFCQSGFLSSLTPPARQFHRA